MSQYTYISFDHTFKGISIRHSQLIPNTWTLTVKMAGDGDGALNEVYSKIQYWLNYVLDDVVAVNAHDAEDMAIANSVSNTPLHCPGYPGDNILVQLFHAKLSALAGNLAAMGPIELVSDVMGVKYTYDCDDDYSLPETNSHPDNQVQLVPWWSRDDGFCFDSLPDEQNEDPMDEYYRTIESLIEQSSETKEPAKIINLATWTPRVV